MKKERLINFRSNEEDIAVLGMAASKLSHETGEKPNLSKAIRHSAEQYANSEPEMFFCNRLSIEQTEAHIETGRQLLQNVFNETKAVTNFELTMEELKKMLAGVVAFGSLAILKQAIIEMVTSLIIVEEQRKYPNLIFSPDQIKLPDTSSILGAATSVALPGIGTNYNIGPYWQVYNLSEGKVTVNPAEVEKLCEPYRIYAVTSEEKTKLSEVKKLCRMLDSFVKNVSSPEKLNVNMVCYYDRISGRFEPSEYYIKYKI